MRTLATEGFYFHHNGSYTGDVTIVDKSDGGELHVPFEDLERLVSAKYLARRIDALEQATPAEILGGTK